MEYKLRDKRTWVKGIVVDCPVGFALENCPVGQIRGLPLPELIRVVNALSEEQLDAIIVYHESCQEKRDAEAEDNGD